MLYFRICFHHAIDLRQGMVIGVEILADFGKYTRRRAAAFANGEILPLHLVHVGRGPAHVGDYTLEFGMLRQRFELARNTLLRTRSDELALMRRNCTKTTSAKTTAVRVNRELDHLVRGNRAALAVFGVRHARVRVLKACVDGFCVHRRVGRIDDQRLIAHALQNAVCVQFVRFAFDCAEVA